MIRLKKPIYFKEKSLAGKLFSMNGYKLILMALALLLIGNLTILANQYKLVKSFASDIQNINESFSAVRGKYKTNLEEITFLINSKTFESKKIVENKKSFDNSENLKETKTFFSTSKSLSFRPNNIPLKKAHNKQISSFKKAVLERTNETNLISQKQMHFSENNNEQNISEDFDTFSTLKYPEKTKPKRCFN